MKSLSLPSLSQLGRFVPSTLSRDLPSSFVVFLVAMPLCLGIAMASGVPAERGLITGIIGGIVVGLLAGSPLQVSGPAAGLAVIVFEFVSQHGLGMLGPVLVLAGLFQLAASAMRVGGWFRAISPAVVHGMLAGIGVLIVLAQIHVLTDATPKANGLENLSTIPEAFIDLTASSQGGNLAAVLVGLATMLAMVGWEKVRPQAWRLMPGALVGVVAGTVVALVAGFDVKRVVLPEAFLSSIALPSLGDWSRLAEPTMISMALMLAVIASAESLLSAAAVDRMHDGPRTRYNKELGAQGVGNVLCGLAGGLPMTGVIVRSSANVQAGAVTRASTVLHGIWILLFILALPWLIAIVPTAALAGILVVTGWRLVGPAHVRHLWSQYGAATAAIWFATMVTVVATDLLTGVLVGLALSFLQVLPALRKGKLKIVSSAGSTQSVSELRLAGSATFLQLPHLNQALERAAAHAPVRIGVHRLRHVDHTCLETIRDWASRRNAAGASVEVVGRPGLLRDRLAAAVGGSAAH